MRPILLIMWTALQSFILRHNNNGLLTDPLGGSSLLNYINYNNYKINQIMQYTIKSRSIQD